MPKMLPNAQAADTRGILAPEEWRAAREKVARLTSARERRLFFALLSHLERGWEILCPLHIATNRLSHPLALRRSIAEDVAAFIECDPIDVFRGLAHTCMHAVPGTAEPSQQKCLAIVLDDAGDVARYLRILALAADHPEFPPELREPVCAAAMEISQWQTRLADVLEPVDNCVHGAGAASTTGLPNDSRGDAEARRSPRASPRLRIFA